MTTTIIVVALILTALLGVGFLVRATDVRTPSGGPASVLAPEEQKRLLAAAKQLGLFMQASLFLVAPEDISSGPRRLGTMLYFTGAADWISQRYKMDETEFYLLALTALTEIDVPEKEARALLGTLSILTAKDFGRAALTEGGSTIAKWLTSEDDVAPVRLSELVREWPREQPVEA
jgi:hypothetical protein